MDSFIKPNILTTLKIDEMKIFYHNTSKFRLNLDREEMLQSYSEGDTILRTEAGDALTEFVEHYEIQKMISDEEE